MLLAKTIISKFLFIGFFFTLNIQKIEISDVTYKSSLGYHLRRLDGHGRILDYMNLLEQKSFM